MSPRLTKLQWCEHVTKWRASGLSCRDYAARAGLNHHTLASYAKRRADPPVTIRADFVELAPVEPNMPQPLDLQVQVGEFHIHVPSNFDATTLVRVLEVLEARR